MFSEGAAAFLVSPVLIASLFSVTGLFCAVSGFDFVFSAVLLLTSSLGFLLKSAAAPAPTSPVPSPIPPALSQSFPCHVLWLLCSVKFLSSFLGSSFLGSAGLAGSAGLTGSGFPKLSSAFGAVFPSRGT